VEQVIGCFRHQMYPRKTSFDALKQSPGMCLCDTVEVNHFNNTSHMTVTSPKHVYTMNTWSLLCCNTMTV